MRLHRLVEPLEGARAAGLPDPEITSLTDDSRQVSPGALFVAVRGGSQDGHRFLADAVRRGAAAAVGEELDPGLGIPYLQQPDSRLALARLAAAWHGYPARHLVMVGITGTDGKTTTCNLLHNILLVAGLRSGMITTVNAVIGDRVLDTGFHVTTPDALAVQGYLAEMVRAGLTHCVLEVTSHGLAQHRVGACEFDVAVVTNVTHEHLDYHRTYADYLETKGRLFAGLNESPPKADGPRRSAILNLDDSSYGYLARVSAAPVVTYGVSEGAQVRGEALEGGPGGIRFLVSWKGDRFRVEASLAGLYNVSNCLAAFAAAVEGLGILPAVAAEGIRATASVPGRMERIDLGQPFTAIVDFAHTPNALRRALETARGLTKARVIAVFGAAGLRDRAKRRSMPAIATELADRTVLTAEDPRTESLEKILAEMAAGAEAQGGVEGETFWRVPDRGEAIRFAVRQAAPGDLVIVCGKGHEQSMCFGDVEHPWDDRVAMRAALAEILNVPGPEMPRLPTSP
jgi:UDP-N-acetylmuramoyl-L-alanyl-D-glutamate--2,6-diaminopimelate ligase